VIYHQQNWPSRYNWNIFESGVKHHKHAHTLIKYIPTLTAVHTTKSRLLSTNTNKMYCYLLKNDFDSRWHISEFVLCLSQLHWIHVRMALRHAVPHNYCFVKFLPYWWPCCKQWKWTWYYFINIMSQLIIGIFLGCTDSRISLN
jgi:hypothetical protein